MQTTSSRNARKDNPLVSIIINNYNYGMFLPAAIRSALVQTYPNVETIVVDDGSTDASSMVMASFGDKIKSVFKQNGGQGSAYNRGFEECAGDFILYLDADDTLDPEAISECLKAWEPGVAKVHFYLRMVEGLNATSTDVLLPRYALAEGNLVQQILETGFYHSPPASGNLYTREILAKILPMPETEWRIGADTYPIYLSPFLGEIRACNKPLGYYRVHSSNTVAHTKITGEILRRQMLHEIHTDDTLFGFCAHNNLKYDRGTGLRQTAYAKLRLASLVLEPEKHPITQDRMPDLLWTTIRQLLRCPSSTLKGRFLTVAWALAVACSPVPLLERLMIIGFVPTKRPSFLRSILVQASKGYERSSRGPLLARRPRQEALTHEPPASD